MKTVYTADRAEGGIFVCFSESGDKAEIPAESLPAGFGEGWRIVFEDGGNGVTSEHVSIKFSKKTLDKLFSQCYNTTNDKERQQVKMTQINLFYAYFYFYFITLRNKVCKLCCN